jgi:hypothetical protein
MSETTPDVLLPEQDPRWYVGERAELLAAAFLTESPDIRVERTTSGPDHGLDLMAYLRHPGGMTDVRFGVVTRGVLEDVELPRRRSDEQPFARLSDEQIGFYGRLRLPVLLFFWRARDDAGWCRWLVEPILTGRETDLRLHPAGHLTPIDRHSLPAIIKAMRVWHAAQQVPVGAAA